MTVSLKHKFVSAKTDGPDATQVRPSNWNDEHDLLMATNRVLGRVTAGDGATEELTGTQITVLLDVFTSSLKGVVPASGGGTTNFLRADGTWAAPSGGGGLSDGDKGDITVGGSGTTLTIDAGAVTLAKMANLAANSIIGNNTGSAATPIALTATQVKALLAIAQSDVTNLTTDLAAKLNLSGGTMTGKLNALNTSTTTAGLNLGAGGADPSSPSHGDVWVSTGTNFLIRLSGTTYFASFINKAETYTAKKTTLASATGGAGFNVPHGAAPSSPADGDLWSTTAGFYGRVNGVTIGPFGSGGGGNTFSTIAVSGQSDVVADSASDTLTLVAGTNISITTNASTDTITINATGGGGGDLLSTNNLSDVANTATARTNLGLGTGNSPQFTGIELGNASDTTLTRSAAGEVSIEGSKIITAGTIKSSIQATINGGGAVITSGKKGQISVPFGCTIVGWTAIADASGSISVQLNKSTYSGFPTTSSIVASAPISLSSVQKNTSTTLTGWTTSVTAGDIIEFEVTGTPATITRLQIMIEITR